jgi:DNA sulfur modification protein DndE
VINAQNSRNITLDGISFKPSDVFMKVTGERSKNIRLINTDVKDAIKDIELGKEVSKTIITRK